VRGQDRQKTEEAVLRERGSCCKGAQNPPSYRKEYGKVWPGEGRETCPRMKDRQRGDKRRGHSMEKYGHTRRPSRNRKSRTSFLKVGMEMAGQEGQRGSHLPRRQIL